MVRVGAYDAQVRKCFSALQRAEIAEILACFRRNLQYPRVVSVLFNEPKLLKFCPHRRRYRREATGFSALQRAEIAEIEVQTAQIHHQHQFQCSSTSRNC